MAAHTPEHTQARLASVFESYVARAEEDIMAELRHPRRTGLTVNNDRAARWTAAQKLVALGRVILVVGEHERATRRSPTGKPPRMRLEMRIRLPAAVDAGKWAERI